jgi:hypothetical protein
MAAFAVIEHQELDAAAGTITFAAIPSSYDHLYLKGSLRTDHSAYLAYCSMQYNDSASNYSWTTLRADTSTLNSYRSTTSYAFISGGTSILADTFSTLEVWIPNYANTANFKQILSTSALENDSTTNAQWHVSVVAQLWSDTSAISEIDLANFDGGDFVEYTNLTLYGVTGA